jgi:hypothetical protein
LKEAEDAIEDGDGRAITRSRHKIGGRPCVIRERSQSRRELDGTLRQGFLLVAQFDFPSGEDALVSGDWPFADGLFAILARTTYGDSDWRWYWDF